MGRLRELEQSVRVDEDPCWGLASAATSVLSRSMTRRRTCARQPHEAPGVVIRQLRVGPERQRPSGRRERPAWLVGARPRVGASGPRTDTEDLRQRTPATTGQPTASSDDCGWVDRDCAAHRDCRAVAWALAPRTGAVAPEERTHRGSTRCSCAAVALRARLEINAAFGGPSGTIAALPPLRHSGAMASLRRLAFALAGAPSVPAFILRRALTTATGISCQCTLQSAASARHGRAFGELETSRDGRPARMRTKANRNGPKAMAPAPDGPEFVAQEHPDGLGGPLPRVAVSSACVSAVSCGYAVSAVSAHPSSSAARHGGLVGRVHRDGRSELPTTQILELSGGGRVTGLCERKIRPRNEPCDTALLHTGHTREPCGVQGVDECQLPLVGVDDLECAHQGGHDPLTMAAGSGHA